MEQNFQTSFIPKKPMMRENVTYSRPIGFFTVIALFILLTVVLVSGAFYFYKGVVTKNLASMSNDLALAKNRFEPEKISELKLLDRRLEAGREVLSKHIMITPIFQALQAITMKTIRYTDFSYTFSGDLGTRVKVKMSGVALGYSYLALQSDLYAQSKNFFNPIFSNLTLNEKGNVVFDLEFDVDPSFVDYKLNLLTAQKEQAGQNLLNAESLNDLELDASVPELPELSFPDEQAI